MQNIRGFASKHLSIQAGLENIKIVWLRIRQGFYLTERVVHNGKTDFFLLRKES